jgi:hypothetical protein
MPYSIKDINEYEEAYLHAYWGNFYYYSIVPMLSNSELKNNLKSLNIVKNK